MPKNSQKSKHTMSPKQASLEILKKGRGATLYTIIFEGEDMSEFAKFMTKFRNNSTLYRDLLLIVRAVEDVALKGALERRFRVEGKMADGVGALPLERSKLRLYCLRLTDKIVVIGNGGVKDTRTYNENTELNGYVMDLQNFERVLREAVLEGLVTIEQDEIRGSNDLTFSL